MNPLRRITDKPGAYGEYNVGFEPVNWNGTVHILVTEDKKEGFLLSVPEAMNVLQELSQALHAGITGGSRERLKFE